MSTKELVEGPEISGFPSDSDRSREMFPNAGQEAGVQLNTVRWIDGQGAVQSAEVELWRPTGARPGELRIARISDLDPWTVDENLFKTDAAGGLRWFFLLVKDDKGAVWARLLREANLGGEDPRFQAYVRERVRGTTKGQSTRGWVRWKTWEVDQG